MVLHSRYSFPEEYGKSNIQLIIYQFPGKSKTKARRGRAFLRLFQPVGAAAILFDELEVQCDGDESQTDQRGDVVQ